MLNVLILLRLTEDNFFFRFRYMGVNRLPCASHYSGKQTQQCFYFCSFPPLPCYSSSHRALRQPPYICFSQGSAKDTLQELFRFAGSTNHLLLCLKSQNHVLQQMMLLARLQNSCSTVKFSNINWKNLIEGY